MLHVVRVMNGNRFKYKKNDSRDPSSTGSSNDDVQGRSLSDDTTRLHCSPVLLKIISAPVSSNIRYIYTRVRELRQTKGGSPINGGSGGGAF